MEIWKSKLTIEELTEKSKGTMIEHVGIEFIEIGEDYIIGRMPVFNGTLQLFGRVHGGASVVLAETLGSIGAGMCADLSKEHVVGMEINANHVRGVKKGWVTGIASPAHVGKTTQVWEIRMFDDDDNLSCISRLTTATIQKDKA